MKKIMCCLMICACFAGGAYAQEKSSLENQNRKPVNSANSKSTQEVYSQKKFASDIISIGINKAVEKALQAGMLSLKDIISVAEAQNVKPANLLKSLKKNGVNSNDVIGAQAESLTPNLVTATFADLEPPKVDQERKVLKTAAKKTKADSNAALQKYALEIKKIGINKAMKNALKEGAISVDELINVAVAQGVKPVQVLRTMNFNGIGSNEILAAKVEGISTDLVIATYEAVVKLETEMTKSDNNSKVVKEALKDGFTAEEILNVTVSQSASASNVLATLSLNGVNANDIIASSVEGISSDLITNTYQAVEELKSGMSSGANVSETIKETMNSDVLSISTIIEIAVEQNINTNSVIASLVINGADAIEMKAAASLDGVSGEQIEKVTDAVEEFRESISDGKIASNAVEKTIGAGILSVESILEISVTENAATNTLFSALSLSGVKAEEIIAAKVEGVTAEQVTTVFAAVEQYKADIVNSDNADKAVKAAVDSGILSLDSIIEVAAAQGVNSSNVLTAMSNSGVNISDAVVAAESVGVTADTVQQVYNNPVVPSDTQAYTPPEDRGQQPDKPSDQGQRPDTMPVNAATPAIPTFTLPVGPIGGGVNGPPEDFTPASPSRPI